MNSRGDRGIISSCAVVVVVAAASVSRVLRRSFYIHILTFTLVERSR